jgi:uncharacterized protein YhaN
MNDKDRSTSAAVTTRPQTAASDSAARDRGKLIILMNNLEAALAAASFKREDQWNGVVQCELQELQIALRDSRFELNSKEGLFAEIAADHPRLIHRIDNLKQEFSDLERQITTLKDQFRQLDQALEVADIRERLSWLLKALRHAQAKENELVFEAIGRDLGGMG